MLRGTAGERVIPDLLLLLPMFFNPSVTACHLRYILRCKTQGRSFKISPIMITEMLRNAAGHGRGGGVIPAAETKLGIDLFPYIVSQRRGRD